MWGIVFGTDIFIDAGLFSKVRFENHVWVFSLFAGGSDCVFIRQNALSHGK